MPVDVSNSPVSWGVHYGEDSRNLPWQAVLRDIADAGYRHVELGVLGYVPDDGPRVSGFLAECGLTPTSMYIFQPARTDSEAQRDVLHRAERTARLLSSIGARHLVIIDERNPTRIPTAGRSDLAPRLDDEDWDGLLVNITGVARIAAAHGIRAVLHPHVAGYIEFEDEITRALEGLDPADVGLCLDTGHCAYAGLDAAGAIRRWGARLEHLHLKDVDGPVLASTLRDRVDFDAALLSGIFCPLGKGVVDFPAVAEALADVGYGGLATVEQDHEPGDPDRASKARAGAVESLEFLRDVGIATSNPSDL